MGILNLDPEAQTSKAPSSSPITVPEPASPVSVEISTPVITFKSKQEVKLKYCYVENASNFFNYILIDRS